MPSTPLNRAIIPFRSTIIIGLSGGPDSIYLLHQLHAIKDTHELTLLAVHIDHEWQSSSNDAAQLCQLQCDQLCIPLIIKKLSQVNLSLKWNGSQEEIGRNARRHIFTTIAEQYQANAIALAHHDDDQQETFFIRLLRGSSVAGLTCMKPVDGLYIRPILHLNKQQILDFFTHHAIGYYTDPTNAADTYLRNRIRHHVIPALRSADDRYDKNMASTILQLQATHDFVHHQTVQFLTTAQTADGINLPLFLHQHPVLQHQIIMQLLIKAGVQFSPSQKLFKEIMRFLEKSRASKHVFYRTWCIIKHTSTFKIAQLNKE